MNRILDNIKFLARNPSFITQFIRRGGNVRKAMDNFRNMEENKHCQFCGDQKRIEIHHVVPVSVDDTLADVEDNFIALCKQCHFVVGHGRNYKSSIINVKELCDRRRVLITTKSEEDWK